MELTVKGMDNAKAQTARIIRGIVTMSQTSIVVGTRLPYGYGQEFGTHRRSGKLARRDGGATYLTRAKDAVLADADRDLGEGLTKVTAPGAWVIRRLAKWVRRLARANAPVGGETHVVFNKKSGVTKNVKPGRLRRSIHLERESGGRV